MEMAGCFEFAGVGDRALGIDFEVDTGQIAEKNFGIW